MTLNESIVEDAALEGFHLRRLLRRGYEGQEGCVGRVGEQPSPPPSPRLWRSGRLRRTGQGYADGHGAAFAGLWRAKPSLVPVEPAAERDSFSEVVLAGRLREAIRRLNPAIPEEARATTKRYLRVRLERRPNP